MVTNQEFINAIFKDNAPVPLPDFTGSTEFRLISDQQIVEIKQIAGVYS